MGDAIALVVNGRGHADPTTPGGCAGASCRRRPYTLIGVANKLGTVIRFLDKHALGVLALVCCIAGVIAVQAEPAARRRRERWGCGIGDGLLHAELLSRRSTPIAAARSEGREVSQGAGRRRWTSGSEEQWRRWNGKAVHLDSSPPLSRVLRRRVPRPQR